MIREDTRILKKENLEHFVENLLRERIVFAPVKKGGLFLLDKIKSPFDLFLSDGKTKNSAKGAIFSQTESLFSLCRKEGEMEIDMPSKAEKGQVLFGIRPCDARGMLALDEIFGGTVSDPYYTEKRASTIVIGLACAIPPDSSCFCLSMGGGPCSVEGSDLMFLDLGDRFLVETASEKGREILKDTFFESPEEEDFSKAEKIRKESEESMKSMAFGNKVPGQNMEKQLETIFNDPLWDDIAETCLSCGICAYLCPTCHCFDICDEAAAPGVERIRIWDSCQFPLFTQQASGFNPRPSSKERYRQRIMHKFSYLPGNGNMKGCVGCGRCVTDCPVNLDIREVLVKLSKCEVK